MASENKSPDTSEQPFVHRLLMRQKQEKFQYRIVGGVLVAPAILIGLAIFIDIHGWIKLGILIALIAAFVAFLVGVTFLISSFD